MTGVAFQTLFRNALAEPYTLGVAGGAALGAVAALQFMDWSSIVGFSTVTVASFLGAAAVGLVLVALAHAPSGANWVASSVLLQKRTVDRFRGRVFSTEWLLVTLADSASILTASLLMEAGVLDLRTGILAFGMLQMACGAVWILVIVPKERQFALR